MWEQANHYDNEAMMAKSASKKPIGSSEAQTAQPGPAVDAAGQSAIDPTENVKALNKATIDALRDIVDLRAYHQEREMELRASFQEKLDAKEAERIDANRAQDQDSARRQTEAALTAVQALAAQVPITADAVRNASAAAMSPVLERLTNIERVQYEQAGQKAQVGESKQSGAQTWAIVAICVGIFGTLTGFIFAAIGVIVLLSQK